jgi:predicted amidophosphoribosyltransferase
MLIAIDEVSLPDHSYLSDKDKCYYFMLYYSKQGFDYSDENSLIFNLKKPMKLKDKPHFHYKESAIKKIAKIVESGFINAIGNIDECTIIPIPPSKTKDHEHYDDRVLKILELATKDKEVDIREILMCKESVDASHETENRPSIAELEENLLIDRSVSKNVKPIIVLFDDVLTTGAHFIACKNVLQARYPDAKIVGVFVARRAFVPVVPDADGWMLVR